MADSNSFSSLLALVDSHLSKTSIQESHSEDNGRIHQIRIPSLTHQQNGTQSEPRLFTPNQRLPIPTFNLSNRDSPITNILMDQVTNMLKAKELEKQQKEEKLKLTEEMNKMKLEDDDCVIDLMQALQPQYQIKPELQTKNEVVSSSSSLESLFEPKFLDCDILPEKIKPPEPLLPCVTDMSYILRKKIKRGKCSAFGRVLTAKVRPVAAPYLREHIESGIKRFQFDVKSPCDLVKEKLRKRTVSATYNFDIMQYIMSE